MIEKERWQRVDTIYHQALTYDTDQREAFLDQACHEDSDLRREVDSLLQFDGRVDGFIEKPAIEVAAKALANETNHSRPKDDVGPYRLLTLLGRGGTGEVYLAIDTRLGRKVAIKLLSADLLDDPERISRFKQEARATSTLTHPNIVTIFEIGEADNRHYIVTEYVEGETLREFLAKAGERLTVAQAVSIASQLIDALDTAHKAGIIHRDIKPDNIIIRHNGFVKVLDFGIAKLTSPGDAARTDHLTTRTGIVMGTASYMSPEQTRGQKVDHRTDIFAVGVLLYEMLSGSKPFDGDTWSDVIAAVLVKEPVRLSLAAPHVPPGLQRVVERCLEKAPENRFQSAADLGFSLKSFLESYTSAQTQEKGVGSRARSSRAQAIWVAVVAVLVLAVGSIWLSRKLTAQPEEKLARKPVISVGTGKTRLRWLDRSGNELGTVGEPAAYSGPALSANEDRVVVSINDPEVNSRDLWILSPDSKTRLTTEQADDLNPLWTPDDQWIIYTSERGGVRNIFRKRVDNSGPAEPVLQGKEDMNVEDLTRDGRLLIFNVRNNRDDVPSLGTLTLRDGKRASYNTSPSRAARFSPDGRWVAYQADSGIVVRSAVASSFARSREYLIARGNPKTPMWRGDGKELFYLDNHTLMAVTINVTGSQLTASAPVPLFKANFEEEERRNRYVVTRDGQRFLVIVKDGQ